MSPTPVWEQRYLVFGQGLPISALIASIPILLLLFLIGVKRRPSWQASLAGLFTTAILATWAYGLSWRHVASSAVFGAAFGLLPITWIVFWALVLYRLSVETGKFEIIKASISTITADTRLQILLIAFAFGAFLEGCSGFGTPVAVAAAMMTGLGFSAWYASAICLLANTAPVAFGAIATPIITLAGITGLPLEKLSADVGRICAPVSFLIPAYIILVTCGRTALVETWPAALACGGAFAGFQFLISNFVGAQLTDIVSSVAAIVSLVCLLRFWKPKIVSRDFLGHSSAEDPPTRNVSADMAYAPGRVHTRSEVFTAWLPYLMLVLFVLAWGYPPIQRALNTVSISIHWPALHNEITRVPPVVTRPSLYAAVYNLNWLSAAGTACMFAAVVSAFLLHISVARFFGVLRTVVRQLLLPTLTVTAVLAMAFAMNYSGATGTLGLAFSATGPAFPFFSALLGWLGVFLTGSDTSANALFGGLQVVTAQKLGLGRALFAASNSAGGVMGKMISLQTIAVAAAATGLTVPEQARLFRFTLRHSLLLASVVGLEVVIYTYVFRLD
jgi:L-lactate transport